MRYAILLFLFLHLAAVSAPAQVRQAPFETLDLGLTVLADINHGALHRWWSVGPALGLGLTTPFYLGSFELGLQYAHPSPRSDDVPGFRSLFVYAGWGGRHDLPAGLAAAGGFRVGVMAMRFDGDTLPPGRANESELGVAGRVALRWTPSDPWFAETSVSYQSVMTRPRMEQVFLAAGIGRRFGTPAWLREFLD